MLTDFQKYFTVAESVVNLQEIRIYIFPHTLNMSLLPCEISMFQK